MSYRVTILTADNRAAIVEYASRSEAEQYARDARREDPQATVHVTGQHEPDPVSLERAREWMGYLRSVWAAAPAFTDHKHAHGWQHCPICSRHRA